MNRFKKQQGGLTVFQPEIPSGQFQPVTVQGRAVRTPGGPSRNDLSLGLLQLGLQRDRLEFDKEKHEDEIFFKFMDTWKAEFKQGKDGRSGLNTAFSRNLEQTKLELEADRKLFDDIVSAFDAQDLSAIGQARKDHGVTIANSEADILREGQLAYEKYLEKVDKTKDSPDHRNGKVIIDKEAYKKAGDEASAFFNGSGKYEDRTKRLDTSVFNDDFVVDIAAQDKKLTDITNATITNRVGEIAEQYSLSGGVITKLDSIPPDASDAERAKAIIEALSPASDFQAYALNQKLAIKKDVVSDTITTQMNGLPVTVPSAVSKVLDYSPLQKKIETTLKLTVPDRSTEKFQVQAFSGTAAGVKERNKTKKPGKSPKTWADDHFGTTSEKPSAIEPLAEDFEEFWRWINRNKDKKVDLVTGGDKDKWPTGQTESGALRILRDLAEGVSEDDPKDFIANIPQAWGTMKDWSVSHALEIGAITEEQIDEANAWWDERTTLGVEELRKDIPNLVGPPTEQQVQESTEQPKAPPSSDTPTFNSLF